MAYELIIIGGGIAFGLIGFIIGTLLVRRAYKSSPSLEHYRKVIDILTLRKLHHRLYPTSEGDIVYDKKKLKTGEDHIEHYEDMRDELTIRKKKEIEIDTSGKGLRGISIGNIIGAFIAIFVGISILPIITQEVGKVQMNSSSEWTGTLLNLVPGFFALAILGIGIAVLAGILRNSGMI